MNAGGINLIGLTVFSAMLAVGQLLFKKAGLAMHGLPLRDGLLGLVQLPVFYAAILLYAAATFLWIWLLSRVTLMQAYPWVAAGIVIVPLLSSIVFGERVAATYWVGAMLIIIGIAVTQYSVRA